MKLPEIIQVKKTLLQGIALSAPLNILLVEDDPGDVLLVRRVLKRCETPISLAVANDGIEALSYLRQEEAFAAVPRPDLIILDLNMPRMDGRETLAAVKADPSFRVIPVAVLTTSDADRDIEYCYEMQASCFLSKPMDLSEYTRVVTSLCEFWGTCVKFTEAVAGV